MVAIVNPSPSLNDAFNYNENKVKAGSAECLMAANYPKDLEKLGDTDKLMRLKNLAALNERTQNNSIHITLNFHSSDVLDDVKMKSIAEAYMQKIGFSEQPYLVYKHNDAGHPHMHIVTTNIKENGKGIDMYLFGKRISSPAREEIENQFNLVNAKGRGEGEWSLSPVEARKVIYGKTETKKAIADVINYVSKNYKFTSVAELNAVLKQYNVIADGGARESRIYKNGGLIYQVLDEKGEKIGVPIKSSSISTKPTLKNLNKKFEPNSKSRDVFKDRIKGVIDWAIMQNPKISINQLSEILKQDQIDLVIRQNELGRIYGITYVDHKSKTVFNGSDLGKEYAAGKIQERIEGIPVSERPFQEVKQNLQDVALHVPQSPIRPNFQTEKVRDTFHAINIDTFKGGGLDIFKNMFSVTNSPGSSSQENTPKKKRKKKRKY